MRLCHLRPTAQGISVTTPYDAAFVAAFKAGIPAASRKWDPDTKTWIVAPQCASIVASLIEQHFGQIVQVPMAATAKIETRMLKLEYLGAAKDRGDGTQSAFGWVDNGWNAVFPIAVLQSWFCVDIKPSERPTLYGVLGLPQTATAEEIKKAFRRLALQWHPDHCAEVDAAAQFRTIKDAYDVLTDPQKRARYEAGLQLTAGTPRVQTRTFEDTTWRPPLRCGWLLVEGTPQVGRFVVSRITQWHDIVENGRTLTVSWPRGAQTFEKRWV